MRNFALPFAQAIVCLALFASCVQDNLPLPEQKNELDESESGPVGLRDLARILSAVPLQSEQMNEVYNAVSSSSTNGYDEEYTMKDLFTNPGAGVGSGAGTKSDLNTSLANSQVAMRDLISDYVNTNYPSGTKSGASAQAILDALQDSDMQIYWPYSEDWDNETFPIITFDPGLGLTSNYGYEVSVDESGMHVIDSVYVDENVAKQRPVWVVNRNSDSGFKPVDLFAKPKHLETTPMKVSTRKLSIKSFKMLRNYDSWFGGASEFWVKCGSVEGFTASSEAELRLYKPSVTDFVVVVKRKYLDVEIPFDAILMTDFSNQLDKLAFLITEDDGGTSTSWKCSATVKVNSKSYGFDIDIPYHDRDDIVWRGQLSASFFQESDVVRGRFGDVELTFALD